MINSRLIHVSCKMFAPMIFLQFFRLISVANSLGSEFVQRDGMTPNAISITPYVSYCNNYQPEVSAVTNPAPTTLIGGTSYQILQVHCVNYFKYEIEEADIGTTLFVELRIDAYPNKAKFNPLFAYKIGAVPNLYYNFAGALVFDADGYDAHGNFSALTYH